MGFAILSITRTRAGGTGPESPWTLHCARTIVARASRPRPGEMGKRSTPLFRMRSPGQSDVGRADPFASGRHVAGSPA